MRLRGDFDFRLWLTIFPQSNGCQRAATKGGGGLEGLAGLKYKPDCLYKPAVPYKAVYASWYKFPVRRERLFIMIRRISR